MISVIACGNLNRRDDGAGSAVLARLQAARSLLGRADLRLYDAATDGLAVLFQARDSEQLVLIDACRPQGQPGALYEVPGEQFISRREPPRDSHALRWDDALTIGQRMYGAAMPGQIRVFLIEALDLSLGLELSRPVARSVVQLAARLERELSGSGDRR